MNNTNNQRNRPQATDYEELNKRRGTGQLGPSDLPQLLSDPVNYYYNKLQGNQYMRDDYWTEAARRGESDLLISLLELSKGDDFVNDTLNELMENYDAHLDYDTYMTALNIPFLNNTEKITRVNEDVYDDDGNLIVQGDGYNFGDFTDQEWALEILKYTTGKWDAIDIELAKESANFFEKAGTWILRMTAGTVGNVTGGAIKFVGDIYNVGEGLLNTMINWSQDDDPNVRFLAAFDDDDTWAGNPFGKVSDFLQNWNYDFQRRYTGLVNAVEAHEQGYRRGEGNFINSIYNATNVGAGMNWRGRWYNGVTQAIGYMLPTAALAYVSGGSSLALSAETGLVSVSAGASAAAASITAARSLIFYTGVFSGMVKETVEKAKAQGVSYKDLNAGEVLLNAALKSAVQYAVELGLGAILGFTTSDKLMGIGSGPGKLARAGAESGAKLAQGAVATGWKAAAPVFANMAKEALQEGLEEVSQDLTDVAINWAFDKLGNGNYKYSDEFDWTGLMDSFVTGMLSSIVMGNMHNLIMDFKQRSSIKKALTGKQSNMDLSGYAGVDKDSKPYKLNYFQRINAREAMATMEQWSEDASNPNTPIEKRVEAVASLNAALMVFGEYYSSIGVERATKSDAILREMLEHDSKSKQIEALVKANNYTRSLMDSFLSADAGNAIKYLKEKYVKDIEKALGKMPDTLRDALVSNLDNPITTDLDPNDPNLKLPKEVVIKLQQTLKALGADIIIGADGNIAERSDNVIVVDNKFITDADAESIIKGVTRSTAIQAVTKALNDNQKKLILKLYNQYNSAGTLTDAVAALMFDKSFYTAVLLASRETRKPYGMEAFKILAGIDQVIKQSTLTKVDQGVISEKALVKLLGVVQENMKQGLFNFVTQYQNINLDLVSNEIIPADMKKVINQHKNVAFTRLINESVQTKGRLSNDRITEFNDIIDRLSDVLKPEAMKTLKEAIASNDYLKRVDATITITYMLNYYTNIDGKLTYLPTDGSNILTRVSIKTLNESLGADYREFIDGNYNPANLAKPSMDFNTFGMYDLGTRPGRIGLVRDILFRQSNQTLTIGTNGELLQVVNKADTAKVRYLGKAGDANLLADIKAGRVKTVQDISKIRLDNRIGRLNIEINSSMVDTDNTIIRNGYYIDGDNKIVVGQVNTLSNLMHEITHATQYYTQVGSKPGSLLTSGGDSRIFSVLPAKVRYSLINYVKTNLPISYSILKANNNSDISTIYMSLDGELQAHANISSLLFETGFTWKQVGDDTRAILVSPDGKQEWSMKPDRRKAGNETVTASKEISDKAKKQSLASTKLDLENIPGNVSVDSDIGPELANKIDSFYGKYPALREWVEGLVNKDAKTIAELKASKQEGLKLLYEEMYKIMYGKKGTYQEFLKTPIYFVRTSSTSNINDSPANSVALSYDLDRVPIFGVDSKGNDNTMIYGTLLPGQLVTYLPLSYAEGIVDSKILKNGKTAPINKVEAASTLESSVKTDNALREVLKQNLPGSPEVVVLNENQLKKTQELYDAFKAINPKLPGFEVKPLSKSIGGMYDPNTNKIILNSKRSNLIQYALAHELTHTLEGTPDYDRLLKYTKSFLKRAELYDSMYNDIKHEYTKAGLLENKSQAEIDTYIEQEMMANFAERLFHDTSVIEDIVRRRRSLATRIKDWIVSLWHRLTSKPQSNLSAFAHEQKIIAQKYIDALRKYDPAKNKAGNTIKYMKIGENSLLAHSIRTIDKNMSNLDYAKGMYDGSITDQAHKDSGYTMDEIHAKTGWLQDKDRKWKYTISDSSLKLKANFNVLSRLAANHNRGMSSLYNKLSHIISHDTLFDHYPILKNVGIELHNDATLNWSGYYNPDDGSIHLNFAYLYNEASAASETMNNLIFKDSLQKTLLHEIQHVIQDTEGFAIGGDSDYINYRMRHEVLQNLTKSSADYRNLIVKYYDLVNEAFSKFKELAANGMTRSAMVDMASPDYMAEMEYILTRYHPTSIRAGEILDAMDDILDQITAKEAAYMKANNYKTGEEIYANLLGEQEAEYTAQNWKMTDEEIKANWGNIPEYHRTSYVYDKRLMWNQFRKVKPNEQDTKVTKSGIEISANNMVDLAAPSDYGVLLNKLNNSEEVKYDIDWKHADPVNESWSESKLNYWYKNAPIVLADMLPIRFFTPLEHGRLMGVKDADFNKLAIGQSDSALYRMLGNSIVTDVLQHIFKGMYEQKILDKPVKLIEMFAGYGSQALALKYIGADFEHHKIVEWGTQSIVAYNNLHNNDTIDYSKDLTKAQLVEYLASRSIASSETQSPLSITGIRNIPESKLRDIYNSIMNTNNLVNITQVKGSDLEITDTNNHDYLLTYSFPCQDLSQAGKRAGIKPGTRSGLLLEVERILSELPKNQLPKVLLLENVTQLATQFKADLDSWMDFLAGLGYTNVHANLMASDYGIPQSRNRVFMVSTLSDKPYQFPKPIPLTKTTLDLLQPTKHIQTKYFFTGSQFNQFAGIGTNSWQSKYNRIDINRDISRTLLTARKTQAIDGNFQSDVLPRNFDLQRLLKPTTPQDLSETIRMINMLVAKGSATSFSEELKTRTISNKFANESNLKYWVKKGTRVQVDPRVQQFVIATTSKDFNKLPSFITSKIFDGTLTINDIKHFVATSDNTNQYTHKMIAEHIYGNTELAKLKPKDLTLLAENLRSIAMLRYVTDESVSSKVMSPNEMVELVKSLNELANVDQDFEKKLAEAYKTVHKDIHEHRKRHIDIALDLSQLAPILYNHYDGTIESIYNIEKQLSHQMYKQEALRLDNARSADIDNEDMVQTKTKSYGWLDNIKQTSINYDYKQALQAYDGVDKWTMYDAIEKDITNRILDKYVNLSKEELGAQRKSIEAELRDQLNKLDNMTDQQLTVTYSELMSAEMEGKNVDPRFIEGVVKVDMSEQPTMKNAKDLLRNRARTVTQRIAGLKSKYNMLPDLVKQNLDSKSYKLTKDYQNMTFDQVQELSKEMSNAMKILRDTIKTQKAGERKQAAIEKRLQRLANQEVKVKERIESLKKQESTMRGKIRNTFSEKVKNTDAIFKSDSPANNSVKTLLTTQWEATRKSTVKGIGINTDQNVHNGKVFFNNNSDVFLTMDVAEAEATANWFMEATINNVSRNSSESQAFEAIRLYTLGHIYSESRPGGQFEGFNANLRQSIEAALKNIATNAGTGLAVWNNIKGLVNPLETMMSAEMILGGVVVDDTHKDTIIQAVKAGDFDTIQRTVNKVIDQVNKEKPPKQNILRRISAVRSMFMLSGPLTWLRLQVSKRTLRALNKVSSFIGNKIAPSNTKSGQIKLTGQVTTEIQGYIQHHFLDSGLFDTVINNLSRYNPSSIKPKYKDATGKANKDTILYQLVIKSMYNQYYNQNIFNKSWMNTIHQQLMKVLTDNKIVRETALRYFGKILAERGYGLSTTTTEGNIVFSDMSDAVMNDFAAALGLAMSDYMHSDNMFSRIESMLAEKSDSALFAFKLLLPFAKAQWNWFKGMLKYTPVGLVQSIIKFGHLEQQIIKAETAWASGKTNIHPDLVESQIRRDMGSGAIGTMGVILGLMLAGLGYIDLEEEDYGTPKLRVGNIRVDISSIFGSTSILAGAALVKGWENADDKHFINSLNAMLDPVLDGFFLTQIMALDKYSYDGFASTSVSIAEQIVLSFVPNLFKYISGMTYSGKVQTNNLYQKAIKAIPFLSATLPKKVNPYTGKHSEMWDIFNRVVPYVEVRTGSVLESKSKALGVNKIQLRGNYEINGEKFKLNPKDAAELNKMYGQWNADRLAQFYSNKSLHKVQTDKGNFVTIRYNQMTEKQRQNTVHNIFNKNSDYVKIYAWIKAGNKYYASESDYIALRKLGLNRGLFKGNKGFIKK